MFVLGKWKDPNMVLVAFDDDSDPLFAFLLDWGDGISCLRAVTKLDLWAVED